MDLAGPKNVQVLRQRKRAQTALVSQEAQQYILKTAQFITPRALLREWLIRHAPAVRAKDSLWLEKQNSHRLAALGIATPEILAFSSQWQWPMAYCQTLKIRYIEHALPMRHYVYGDFTLEQKQPWFQRGIQFALNMHCSGVYHLDFHPENLLFQGTKGWLIDCDQMIFCSEPRLELLIRSLGRLSFGMRDHPPTQAYFDALVASEINRLAGSAEQAIQLAKLYQQGRNGLIKGSRLRYLYHKGLARYVSRFCSATASST